MIRVQAGRFKAQIDDPTKGEIAALGLILILALVLTKIAAVPVRSLLLWLPTLVRFPH